MIVGKLPKSQANPLQLESHMAQERGKRRELLQKFLDMCSSSQVQNISSFYMSYICGFHKSKWENKKEKNETGESRYDAD